MSSLLGHVLGAEAVLGLSGRLAGELSPGTARARRAMWVAGIVAIIPDLDVAAYLLLGRPGWLAPHTISHSLLFALGLAVLGAGFATKNDRGDPRHRDSLRMAGVFAAVTATHLLLDFLMGYHQKVGLPWGVPLLAPFWNDFLVASPWQVVPTAYYSAEGWEELLRHSVLNWKSWLGVLIEAMTLVPLVVMAWSKRMSFGARCGLAAASAAGFVLTYFLYDHLHLIT